MQIFTVKCLVEAFGAQIILYINYLVLYFGALYVAYLIKRNSEWTFKTIATLETLWKLQTIYTVLWS